MATEFVPALPLEDFELTPLLLLTAVSVALALAALATFRRRDLTAN